MDTSAETEEGCREELTGRKKLRFKLLKSRLFGRRKRKDSEGLIKQSQSASDVTADVIAGGAAGGYNSEDDCMAVQGTLGSRALSHDSIFLADQSQDSVEPARVLSQENVHGKIRALQLKLQHQNMCMGPPPLLIPGKRMEDTGATSEDDGLPHSPPDVSFSDRAGQGSSYKLTILDSHRHHSSLSLAGTGSEEEEQWSSRPSSRPLSPAGAALSDPGAPPGLDLSDPGAPPGVDLSSPAQYTPSLDSSAARHRLSVKPRNQRASTRKASPSTIGPRSESLSDLDPAATEGGEGPERETTEERGKESRATLATTPEKTFPSLALKRDDDAPVPSLRARPERKPWASADEDVLPQKEEEEGRFTNNPLFLQAMPTENHPSPVVGSTAKTLIPDGPTATPPVMAIEEPQRLPEPVRTTSGPIVHTLPRNAKRELTACGEVSSPLSPKSPLNCPVFGSDGASSPHKPQERTEETVIPETCSNRGLGTNTPSGPAQALSLPTSAPHVTRPPQRPASLAPPAGVEETTAPPPGQGETLPEESSRAKEEGFGFGWSSHRFFVSSARLRPSGGGEEAKREGGRGREGKEKGQSSLTCQGRVGRRPVTTEKLRQLRTDQGEVVCMEPTGESKEQRHTHSRTGTEEGQEEGVGRERKGEGEEGRRGAFGVKLRPTSQSVKYRSETVQSQLKAKRHSVEIMATEEPQPIKGEGGAGSKVGGEKGSERPAWMSVAREMTRSLRQHFTGPAASETTPSTDTRPQQTTQSTDTRPQQTTLNTDTRPQQTTLNTDTRPQQTTQSTDARPQQTTLSTDTRPQQTTLSTDTRPQQTTQSTDTRPQQTTLSTDTRPQQTTLSTDTRPQQTTQSAPPPSSSRSPPSAQLSPRQEAQLKTARQTWRGETERPRKRPDRTAETKTESRKGHGENLSVKPEISSPSSSSSSVSVVSTSQYLVQRGAQPSWMELAKRKSKAWNDKTMD